MGPLFWIVGVAREIFANLVSARVVEKVSTSLETREIMTYVAWPLRTDRARSYSLVLPLAESSSSK
jgi:hypothetical protein